MQRFLFLPIACILLGLLSCSQKPTSGALIAKISTEVVGKWKLIREDGKPATLKKGATGIIEIRADGTLTYEEITEISSDNKVESLNIKQSHGKYHFLDAENMEIEGEDRGQTKKWTVKVSLKDNILTMHKPSGQVDDFERVP